jgi:enoyl-CoA hydratase/carnithine racemase
MSELPHLGAESVRPDIVLADGPITAAQLRAGILLATPRATLALARDPRLWTGLVGRLGRRALDLHLSGVAALDAGGAHAWGVVDGIAESVEGWLGNRSELALQSAAELVRLRAGDAAERAEFARLFAVGEPQEGLRAFLARRRPNFLG